MTHITSTVYLRLQLASALSGSPFNEKTRSTTPLPVGIDFHLSSRAANDLYVDLRVDFSCLTSASVSAWTFNVKKRPRCFESRGVNNSPINIWLFEVSTTHILVWCSFCMIFAEPRKDGLKESWVPKFQWCYSLWALDISAFFFCTECSSRFTFAVQNGTVTGKSASIVATVTWQQIRMFGGKTWWFHLCTGGKLMEVVLSITGMTLKFFHIWRVSWCPELYQYESVGCYLWLVRCLAVLYEVVLYYISSACIFNSRKLCSVR